MRRRWCPPPPALVSRPTGSVGTFDLRGPSIHANTACSSSMTTMDLACQGLRSGQSSWYAEPRGGRDPAAWRNANLWFLQALVTSDNSLLSSKSSLYMSNMNFLSADSRCYSCDHRANGYARGEGVIVLVLKTLSDTIRDVFEESTQTRRVIPQPSLSQASPRKRHSFADIQELQLGLPVNALSGNPWYFSP